MKQRFDALTGVRAIAASMVFLYHNKKYWRSFLPEFLTRNLNEFHCGVSLFFVLSGFLIAYNYQDFPTKTKKDYTKYVAIRLLRIFPVYFILLSIQYIHWGFPVAKDVVYNYTLLKGFSWQFNLNGIPQSWSLTVELCFYFIAPFLFFYFTKSKLKTILSLFVTAFIMYGLGYLLLIVKVNKNWWFYDLMFIFDGTFFGRFTEFLVGVWLAKILLNPPIWLQKIKYNYFTLVGGIISLLLIYSISFFEKNIYSHGTENWWGLCIRNFVLPFAIASFLYGLITEKTWLQKLLSTKLFILLGNASFVFYLIHIGYVNQILSSKFLLFDRNFIVLWLISIAIYLLIEKPIYSLGSKWIKSIKS